MTATELRDADVAPVRAPIAVRVGQGILILLSGMCAAIGVSTMFVDDPFAPEATTMIASFGVLAGALGVGAAIASARSTAALAALCALPALFVWHVAALGTWLPDAPLAAASVLGIALIALGRRRR